MIKVEVRLYATLRKYNKTSTSEAVILQVPEGSNLTTLLSFFNIPEEEARIIIVNHRQQNKDYVLRDGDSVAIFPPVGGG